MEPIKYRPEIDGLRAIAVLPVILFHAGFELFGGGFVGVDVFFVISGYLITSIILSEKSQGTFSLANFYERRARRILPALFLVMLVSLPFGWFWLFPSDFKDYAQSLAATTAFSSNMLFWHEAGYWGVDDQLKPLLHTWSLSVEEQYYVLFPLFILAFWRFGKNSLIAALLLILTSSLAASQWAAVNYPVAAFFLLPTRVWEIAVGAVIAFVIFYRKQSVVAILSNRFAAETLSACGLFMIAYSVFAFSEATPFPGLYALVPTIGAGLIILFSTAKTLVGRILGTRMLVALGLVSYSAYLWHQPIFAFSRHRTLTEPGSLHFIALSIATFMFAFLSWKYVEQPFRVKAKFARSAIIKFAIAGSILFAAIGVTGHVTNGFEGYPLRDQFDHEDLRASLMANHGLSRTCEDAFTLASDCRTSDEPEIVVWGDSYAMHLVQGIVASRPDASLIQFTKSDCGPFFDIVPVGSSHPHPWAEGCLAFNEEVRSFLEGNRTLKYAVISSPFSAYLSTDNQLLGRDGRLQQVDVGYVEAEFRETLIELQSMGMTPIIFSPPPANGVNLGRCSAKAVWHRVGLENCDFDEDAMTTERLGVYSFLESIEESYEVVRLDELMCNNGKCTTHLGSTPLFRDEGHFSAPGSAVIGAQLGFHQFITNNN